MSGLIIHTRQGDTIVLKSRMLQWTCAAAAAVALLGGCASVSAPVVANTPGCLDNIAVDRLLADYNARRPSELSQRNTAPSPCPPPQPCARPNSPRQPSRTQTRPLRSLFQVRPSMQGADDSWRSSTS